MSCIRAMSVICLGFLLAGCASQPSARDVPVIYDTRLDPIPLTDAQKEEVLATVAPVVPKGRRVWYIHVNHSYKSESGPGYSVNVYFTPGPAEGRLRKGMSVHYASPFSPGGWPAFSDEMRPLPTSDELREGLRPYWQVSRAGEPFGKDLAPPSSQMLWPFSIHGVSDDEAVRIVDFIRTGPADVSKVKHVNPDGSITTEFSSSGRVDGSRPILSIWADPEKDDVIHVTTGSVQGPLAGSGQMIELRREGDSYKIIGIGHWNA